MYQYTLNVCPLVVKLETEKKITMLLSPCIFCILIALAQTSNKMAAPELRIAEDNPEFAGEVVK